MVYLVQGGYNAVEMVGLFESEDAVEAEDNARAMVRNWVTDMEADMFSDMDMDEAMCEIEDGLVVELWALDDAYDREYYEDELHYAGADTVAEEYGRKVN